MLPLETIRERLKRSCIADVSRATGLHYNTCRYVRSGKLGNPTYRVMVRLSEYFERDQGAADVPEDESRS